MNVDLNTSFKSGGRSGQSDGGLDWSRNRLRGLLVVSELALSMTLLIGAGLLIRSFVGLQRVPPGFATDHVLTMQVAVATGPKCRRSERRLARFHQEVENRDRATARSEDRGPGFRAAADRIRGMGQINVEGYKPQPGQELQVDLRAASSDYFRSMDIPLLQGRFFSEHDTQRQPQVAIIDEKFAQRFWPHDDPIGKHVWLRSQEAAIHCGRGGGGQTIRVWIATARSRFIFRSSRTGRHVPGGAHVVAIRRDSPGAVIREIHAVDPDAVVL